MTATVSSQHQLLLARPLTGSVYYFSNGRIMKYFSKRQALQVSQNVYHIDISCYTPTGGALRSLPDRRLKSVSVSNKAGRQGKQVSPQRLRLQNPRSLPYASMCTMAPFSQKDPI